MLKKNLKVVLSVFIFFVGSQVIAAVPKYPLLSQWDGQAWVTGKDGKRLSIRAKTTLREKALIETADGSQVKVLLDEGRSFTVLSGSEVSLPAISWEGGEAPVLFIRKGEVRWEQDPKKKSAYNTAIRSDLFEFIAPPGEFVFGINPSQAQAFVKVFDGAMVFSALNGDESVKLERGQQVSFQGVLEEGEIAYDVLLKGKKIPKGKLTAVTAVDAGELNKKAAAEKRHQDDLNKQARQEKAAVAKAKKEGFICSSPAGKFNQCSWVCLNNPKSEKKRCLASKEGVFCVRQRCNANGTWAESTTLDAEKASSFCGAQVIVAPCDY